MATLPTDPAQLLARVKALGPQWVEHAAALGLSPEMITELEATLGACDTRAEEARRARDAAQMATQSYYDAADRLYRASAAIVRTVRANGLNSGDANYFILAGIDVPGPRRRSAPPPGEPHTLRATIDNLGAVRLTWKSRNPRGVANVVYQIMRQVRMPGEAREGAMTLVGLGGGSRTFTDASLPAGAASVSYQVRPMRGRQKGALSQPVILRFGAQMRERVARLAA